MSSNSVWCGSWRRDRASMPQELAGMGIEKDDDMEEAVEEEKLVCRLEKLGRFARGAVKRPSALAIRCRKLVGGRLLDSASLLFGPAVGVVVAVAAAAVATGDDGDDVPSRRKESNRNMSELRKKEEGKSQVCSIHSFFLF